MDEKQGFSKNPVASLASFARKFGKSQWLILLLVGVLLVIITLPSDAPGKSEEKEDAAQPLMDHSMQTQEHWDAYRESMETQLETILEQVEGVGKVRVMVTLSGTGELIVEKDVPQEQSQIEEGDASGGTRKTKESSWKESTVYIQKNGESTPYVVKELVPEIEGICIIAEGGDNGNVVKNISEAVQALFPVELHKIKVMKMK